jgi:hypothetical protein
VSFESFEGLRKLGQSLNGVKLPIPTYESIERWRVFACSIRSGMSVSLTFVALKRMSVLQANISLIIQRRGMLEMAIPSSSGRFPPPTSVVASSTKTEHHQSKQSGTTVVSSKPDLLYSRNVATKVLRVRTSYCGLEPDAPLVQSKSMTKEPAVWVAYRCEVISHVDIPRDMCLTGSPRQNPRPECARRVHSVPKANEVNGDFLAECLQKLAAPLRTIRFFLVTLTEQRACERSV